MVNVPEIETESEAGPVLFFAFCFVTSRLSCTPIKSGSGQGFFRAVDNILIHLYHGAILSDLNRKGYRADQAVRSTFFAENCIVPVLVSQTKDVTGSALSAGLIFGEVYMPLFR